MKRFVTLFTLTLLLTGTQARAENAPYTSLSVRFGLKDHMHTFKFQALKRLFREHEFKVNSNPAYENRSITYRGFLFSDLLASLGNDVNLNDYKIVITCTDGYRPILNAEDLSKGHAFLAYREGQLAQPELATDDHLWTQVKMGDKYVSPGPLYIVWDTPATYPDGWPFQIAEITLVPNDEFKDFEILAPKGAFDAHVAKGYQIFSQNCIVCHSLHQIGPVGKAPDLGFFSEEGVAQSPAAKELIQSKILSGGGAMPSFATKLSDDQIQSVTAYLTHTFLEH